MIIKVKLKPNSDFERIEQVSDNEFFVSLKEPADKNKANISLIKLLKKYFHKDIKIIKGLKSREKIIEVGE